MDLSKLQLNLIVPAERESRKTQVQTVLGIKPKNYNSEWESVQTEKDLIEIIKAVKILPEKMGKLIPVSGMDFRETEYRIRKIIRVYCLQDEIGISRQNQGLLVFKK